MSELLNFILDHEEAFRSKSRLASLYSDFTVQRATNPDGYQANISAWRKALTDAARAGLLPAQYGQHNLLAITTGDELARALQHSQWGRPLALAAVIQDAVARREMIPMQEFLNAKGSIYQRSWAISPWHVISWGLRQLGVMDETKDKLAVGEFLVMANVEAAANAVLAQLANIHTSNIDLIYSREAFGQTFSHALDPSTALSPRDINLLLIHLSRDKHVLSYSPGLQTIKFKLPPSTNPPEPVTPQDETIASLRTLIESLNHQIPALTAKIASLDASARAAVAAKATTPARAALRSKKLAEAALAQRAATLGQLEEVLGKIAQAADQVEVVRVMQASAGVLRGLHREVGGVEGVQDVVDALREEMANVEDVAGVLNEVGKEGAVDEAEVEEEFEAMEAEETKRRLRELEGLEEERKLKEERKIEEQGKVEEETAREGGANEINDELEKSVEALDKMTLGEKKLEAQAA